MLAAFGVCLSLGGCTEPPPATPTTPAVDDSAWMQLQEASRLEAAARVLRQQYRFDEALRSAIRAVEIRRKLLGDGHTDVWRTAELVADLHVDLRQFDLAEIALQFDLSARERALGPMSVELAKPLGMLADLAETRDNYVAAEQLRRRAISVLQASVGPSHLDVAGVEFRLAKLLLDLCRRDETEPLLQHVLEIQQRSPGGAPPDAADTLTELAEVRWIANDDAGAESTLQKAIALLSEHERNSAKPLMNALGRLAGMYADRSLSAEERAARERAVVIGERSLGASNPATINAAASLWQLYREASSPDAADKLLLRLAIVHLERARPGWIAPAPKREKAARCVSKAAPRAPDGVANAASVVAGMAPALRRCYNLVLKKDPNLTGSFRIMAYIDGSGEVARVSTFVPAGSMAAVAECALDTAFQSKFSPPAGGGATIIIPATFVSQ